MTYDTPTILQEAFTFGQRVRREAHRHPELSGQETRTSAFLQRELHALGYQIETIDGGPSFLAYDVSCTHFTMGIRAELDALPIAEHPVNPEVLSERGGVMHACGHDVHMGVACALAYYLAHTQRPQHRDHGVLFVFETSEEKLPGGALAIARSAAFDRKRPATMFAFHCDPAWPVGTLACKAGEYMASGDELHITVRGRGGHGALPHEHDDPLLAGAHLVVTLQSMMARALPPGVPAILSIGRFEALGATNVVPDVVEMQGTLRTHSEEWRAKIKENIRTVAKGIGEAFNVAVEPTLIEGYPTLFNDPGLFSKALDVGSRMRRPARFETVGLRMTTDDFAYFAQTLPSLYVRLGVGTTSGHLHTATFCPSEESIAVALEWVIEYLRALEAS